MPSAACTSGTTARSPRGRIWHARRTSDGAAMRASVSCSTVPGADRPLAPSSTCTLHVEQRPRPPHTDTWGMPRPTAGFEHAEAGRNRDDTTAGIAQAYGSKPLGVPVAQPAQPERAGHQANVENQEPVDDPTNSGGVLRRDGARLRPGIKRRVGRVAPGSLANVESRIREPYKCERRDDRRDGGQDRGGARIPGLGSQPGPNADASMNPDDEQQQILPRQSVIRQCHPIVIEHPVVAVFDSMERGVEPDGPGMLDQQQRDGEAKRQLPDFASGNSQVAAPVERKESKAGVSEKGGVKHSEAGDRLPRLEQDEACRVHGRDRTDAESVIE